MIASDKSALLMEDHTVTLSFGYTLPRRAHEVSLTVEPSELVHPLTMLLPHIPQLITEGI